MSQDAADIAERRRLPSLTVREDRPSQLLLHDGLYARLHGLQTA